MDNNTIIRTVNLNDVRGIFQIAGRLFGDIEIQTEWNPAKSTLTAWHQDEQIEELTGMDAFNGANQIACTHG